jgi:cytidylate kinase
MYMAAHIYMQPDRPSPGPAPAAGPREPGSSGSDRGWAGSAFVVAIDGPAGAGKSTTARALAEVLGYTFLDTGAIYRAVALVARRRGVGWDDGATLGELAGDLDIVFVPDGGTNRIVVDGVDVTSDIRTREIAEGASRVSALPEVRAALLELQRDMGRRGRVVAEGRDTGTVVFPDAAVKFFLTAPVEERARRRARELASAGTVATPEAILEEIRIRDERDSHRAIAPLKKAPDAIEIDSGGLDADEVVARMAATVRERGG